MDTVWIVLLEFLVIFLVILIPGYLIPASIFHLWVNRKTTDDPLRIQGKKPELTDYKREVRLSLSSVLILSTCTTTTYQWIKEGNSLIYYNWNDYPAYYHFLSFLLCLIIHDTYFYWTHRLMHLPAVFKHSHKGHHLSFTPSPWASLAFQPLEAIIQFGTFLLIVSILPVHPVVFFVYLGYDTIVNTAGHCGFELVPKSISGNTILKYGNTVSHHDLHHVNFTKNYGAFFNVWDRLMGTFSEDTRNP